MSKYISETSEGLREFSEWLNRYMEAEGLTQQAVGDAVGVAHVTVGKWQKGTHHPSPLLLRRLAEMAGLPPLSLFVMLGYLPADSKNEFELSGSEITLVKCYRRLSPDMKRKVLVLVS